MAKSNREFVIKQTKVGSEYRVRNKKTGKLRGEYNSVVEAAKKVKKMRKK